LPHAIFRFPPSTVGEFSNFHRASTFEHGISRKQRLRGREVYRANTDIAAKVIAHPASGGVLSEDGAGADRAAAIEALQIAQIAKIPGPSVRRWRSERFIVHEQDEIADVNLLRLRSCWRPDGRRQSLAMM
jgi:hypothetical protein